MSFFSSLFNEVFILDAHKVSSSKLLTWWELRRILFNVSSFGTYALMNYLSSFVFDPSIGAAGGSPLVLIPAFIVAIVTLNTYYAVFEFLSMLLANNGSSFVGAIRPWLFVFATGTAAMGIVAIYCIFAAYGLYEGYIVLI